MTDHGKGPTVTAWARRLARRVPLLLAAALVVAAVAQAAGSRTTADFSNTNAITWVSDCCAPQPAAVYPLSANVAGMSGAISKVTATLKGLTHPAASDLDVLLVAPGGQTVVLMSDVGLGATNANLTFDDSGAAPTVPAFGPLAGSTTYKSTNGSEDCSGAGDTFPTPAPPPGGGYGTSLNVFTGVDAATENGNWSLYVVDDCEVDSGVVGGLDLSITTAGTGGSPSVTTSVAIDDCCPPTTAGLYPSPIIVNGIVGTISGMSVELKGVTHPATADFNVLLIGPHGQQALLLSDAGDASSNANLTFSDAVVNPPVPATGAVTSGIYNSTNNVEDCATGSSADPFPGAPAGSVSPDLTVFDGTGANGTWNLYVVDDCTTAGQTGQIAGGWKITFAGATSVAISSASAKRAGKTVVLRWRTAQEVSVLGFNVYRSSGKRFTRLNKAMIAAKRRTQGGAYSFVDSTARRGVAYTYKVQVVGIDGSKRFRVTAKVKR